MSGAPPTFDELADAALKEMQRQQVEQQQSIERQLNQQNSTSTSSPVVPGVPARVSSSTSTAGGRTVIRKSPTSSTNPFDTKALSTSSPSPPAPHAASPTLPSASSAAADGAAVKPHDPSAEAPMPAAPAEEARNLEIAHLNESNVSALLSQKKANASIQQHLTSSLQAQLQSIAQQQQKLAFIKQELYKLDQQLSDSIDVLRNQIEDVGRQCLALQADFNIKESAYLDARKALAKAKQRKLLLTGHLDFIILTNEKEKAKKLKELERQMFGKEGEAETEAPENGTAGTAPAKVEEEVKAPAFGGFG